MGIGHVLLLLQCFRDIPVVNATCVDHDQTSCYAASDLGLHCLSVALLGVSRLKCVKFSRPDKFNVLVRRSISAGRC